MRFTNRDSTFVLRLQIPKPEEECDHGATAVILDHIPATVLFQRVRNWNNWILAFVHYVADVTEVCNQ